VKTGIEQQLAGVGEAIAGERPGCLLHIPFAELPLPERKQLQQRAR
jgi:hypothetical protein